MKRTILAALLGAAVLQVFAAQKIEITPLAEKPLVSTADFSSASVVESGNTSVLKLTLTDGAAKRLQSFTARNLGAELPIVIDGKIVSSPVIKAAIEGNSFEVSSLERAQAEAIAQRINTQKK